MKRFSIAALILVALFLVVGQFRASSPALAQGDTPALGTIRVVALSKDDTLVGKTPVMVSVISDGKVLKQMEIAIVEVDVSALHGEATWKLPVGLYDVRVEGDGVKSLTKRGINATPNETTELSFPVQKGEGAKVIEYAASGLSREEVAARLIKLEAAVEELKKK